MLASEETISGYDLLRFTKLGYAMALGRMGGFIAVAEFTSSSSHLPTAHGIGFAKLSGGSRIDL